MLLLLLPHLISPALSLHDLTPHNHQERYRGRAQIANTYFVQPKVVNAELIVFEGTQDCIGIMWKEPLDSFSLFTRVTQLPWD